MAKHKTGYSGLDWTISVILAIIPITSIIFGIIERAKKKNNVLGIVLNIIIFPVFWIFDMITIIKDGKVTLLA